MSSVKFGVRDCEEHGERGDRGKRGHRGATGATGPTGPTVGVVPAIAAGTVLANALDPQKGFSGFAHLGTGHYQLTLADSSVVLANIVPSIGLFGSPVGEVNFLIGLGPGPTIDVFTLDSTGVNPVDRSFTIAVYDAT